MTIARAPGKILLSGAYSVLEGAPAIVAAVDRYVLADSSRPATFVSPEVRALVDAGMIAAPPWIDASQLRFAISPTETRKLGLGSSAAATVAALSACGVKREPRAIFEAALAAHRTAQPLGSGADVAASVFGGVLRYQLGASGPEISPASLPPISVQAFATLKPADTGAILRLVRGYARSNEPAFRNIIDPAIRGAQEAASAQTIGALVQALLAQREAIARLGEAIGVPLVEKFLTELDRWTLPEGGVLIPAGAGAGDILLHVGAERAGASVRAELAARGMMEIELEIGVGGVVILEQGRPA